MAGSNDVGILMGILLFLVLLGGFVPILQGAIGESTSSFDTGNVTVLNPRYNSSTYGEMDVSDDWYTGFGMLASIGTALFWVFPGFPWYLTLIHIVIRVIGGVLVYRLIRSGSG